jgi:hypothetical protein
MPARGSRYIRSVLDSRKGGFGRGGTSCWGFWVETWPLSALCLDDCWIRERLSGILKSLWAFLGGMAVINIRAVGNQSPGILLNLEKRWIPAHSKGFVTLIEIVF